MPREAAQVPGGNFAVYYNQHTSVSFGPYEMTSDSWSHPSVPINCLVRSVGVDKPITMTLVGFGTTGATSSF